MSEANVAKRNTIRIYACGGCGTNIGFSLLNALQDQPGYGIVDIAFIDASDRNVGHLGIENNTNVYLVEGLKGSGGKRDENHRIISKHAPEFLMNYRPGDVNIVMSSGGGGSGSVIAPALVNELLKRDLPVVSILVGDNHAKSDMENTVGTIKTYDRIVNSNKKSLAVIYAQNDENAHRTQVNQFVMSVVHALTILFSGQNGELDDKDVFNFLRPERVTSCNPTLCLFSVTRGDARNIRPNSVMSITTLAQDDQYPPLPFKPEVHFLGLINKNVQAEDMASLPFHFILSEGFFHDRLEALNKEIDSINESSNARIKRDNLSGDEEGDGIFVF